MSVFAKNLLPVAGTTHHGVILLFGKVPLGSTGALATTYSAGTMTPGVTVTKTGSKTGRYTLTLAGTVKQLLFAQAVVVGADDAAYTDGNGCNAILRDDDLASDGTIELQLVHPDTSADAEAIDNATVYYMLAVSTSNVTP
jgi:hypothetical protein